MLTVLDLFSGIGGFSYGLERTGEFETVAFCEIEKYPRKVIEKHWPDVPIFEDVRKLYRFADEYELCELCCEPYCELCDEHFADCECIGCSEFDDEIGAIDIITGGFPCQDISVAGKQKGINAERSGLWSECARLLGAIRPQYALFENVTALLAGERGDWFKRVLRDISQIGYDAEWHCIPASECGAHHHRDRVWIICYPKHNGRSATEIGKGHKERNGSDKEGAKSASKPSRSSDSNNMAYSQGERVQGCWASWEQELLAHEIKRLLMCQSEEGGQAYWQVEPSLDRVADGIPDRVDRIKCLGNAIVPQIAEIIGKSIIKRNATFKK